MWLIRKIAVIGFMLLLIGCATAGLKTYVDPSIQPGSINSVAIFPMRNVRLLPDESRVINRSISQRFQQESPKVRILGPGESIDLINQKGLADKYSDFLRNFAMSGIPNVITLKEIGNALDVDAILQGEVFDIVQINGRFGLDTNSRTFLTVRYYLLSTHKGNILWEATSNVKKSTVTVFEPAPPVYEVISIANEKILTSLPKLGR